MLYLTYLLNIQNEDEEQQQKKTLLELKPEEELSEVEKKYSLNALRIFKDRYLLKTLIGFTIKDKQPIYKTVERLDDLFKRVAVASGIIEVLYDEEFYQKEAKPTKDMYILLGGYEELIYQLQKTISSIDYKDLSQYHHESIKINDDFYVNPFQKERLLARFIELLKEGHMKTIKFSDITNKIHKYLNIIQKYYNSMCNGVFLPNTPALMNAGTKIAQNAACFTLPIHDDMESIIKTNGDVMRIFKSGGGIGINYSELRPSGSFISTTGGTSPGPMTFLEIMDEITGGVKQGGKRRGASMAELNCLAGDTLISTLKGRIPIRDLVNSNPLLYCLNENKELRIRRADKIIHNGKRKLLRIKFDNDDWLDCTEDHRLMLRNGSYKEAKDLEKFDSIIAFYKTSSMGRYHISTTVSSDWMNEQVLSAEYKSGIIVKQNGEKRKPTDLCIHHIDENKLNNSPDNLEILTFAEHAMKHNVDELKKHRKRIAEERKGKTLEEVYGVEKARKWKENMSRVNKGKKVWNQGLKGDEYLAHFKNGIKNQFSNHKIISVEYLEGEHDVYDIMMSEYHNFVANGVFVHNCDHPDIESFIDSKVDNKSLTNHNISVVANNKFFNDYFKGDDKAVKLMNKISKNAWTCADPGMVFLENMNSNNLLQSVFLLPIKVTNPCLPGNTRLATSKGLIKMEDLYLSGQQLQVTTDDRTETKDGETTGVQLRSAVPVFKTSDNADVWIIETEHGYKVEATDYHKFFVQSEAKRNHKKEIILKELKDLKVGEKLLIQSDEGYFGNQGSKELGSVIGWYQSDGTSSKTMDWKKENKKTNIILDFYDKKKELSEQFKTYVNNVIPKTKSTSGLQNISIRTSKDKNSNCYSIVSTRLGDLFESLQIQKNKVPEVIWQGSRECVIGYIQALFTADGTVNISCYKSSCSVRLSSIHEEFLKEMQILLGNFGIQCSVLKRKEASERLMPTNDGTGKMKLYKCKANYELIISGKNIVRFSENIGFLLKYKQDTLEGYIKTRVKPFYNKYSYISKIKSITYKGKEAVYDTTEPITNTIVVNSVVSSQCSEIAMYPYDSCNLASINLTKFVKDGKFDLEEFINVTRTVTKFLDCLIDATKYPIAEINDMTKKGRRIGVGFMGLGDVLTILDIPYNSEEGFLFTEFVTAVMSMASLLESNRLAKYKGAFPLWYDEKYPKSELPVIGLNDGSFKRLNDNINKIQKYFSYRFLEDQNLTQILSNSFDILYENKNMLRNCSTTTIAPTGTLSMFVDCSSGIEPIFSHGFTKKVTVGEFNYINKHLEKVLHKEGIHSTELVSRIVKENAGSLYNIKEIPENIRKVFVTAMDIHPYDHLMMQAVAQRWITNGISKTANTPEDINSEMIKNIYILAWKLGVKGTTVYRDGCKSVQVLNNENSLNKPKIKDLKISEYTREYIQGLDLPEDFKESLLSQPKEKEEETLEDFRVTHYFITTRSLIDKGPITFVGNCMNCGAQNSHERSGSPTCFLCKACGAAIGSCN